MSDSFTGASHLVRLVLRRDRVRLPLWILGLGGLIAVSALAVPPIYDTPAKVAGYASAVGASPVSYLMSGRQAGIDTIGGIVANEISQVAQLGICLMVMFLVIRHTRAEEESGRAELLRSGVLGRHASTLAAMLYAVSAAVLIGVVTTGSMLAASLNTVGSLTYGAGLTLLGLCYVTLSLLAAQLASSARGALALAGGIVAAGYLVRGVGAMQDNALVWVSPFGWAQAMNAFGEERWWPALLLLALTGALLATSVWVTAHRDFAGGVLHPRLGPSSAGPLLGTPVGLVLRLQRGLLIGWGMGLFALGLLYGAVMPTVPDLVASNPDIAEFIGASVDAEQALIDAFLRYIFLFMAVLSTGFAVTSVLRLRSEEETGRAEMVLATTVRRSSWVGATLVVATLGTTVLSVLMGLGLALGYGVGMHDWDEPPGQVVAQLSYVPGVLLLMAIAAALTGLLPRASLLAWAPVTFVAVQALLGETLRLPDWVNGISPFWHLPGLPVEPYQVTPTLVLLTLTAALVVLTMWGYRRRDITGA